MPDFIRTRMLDFPAAATRVACRRDAVAEARDRPAQRGSVGWPSRPPSLAVLVVGICVGLGALGIAASRATAQGLVVDQTLEHDGVDRYFDYYVPAVPASPAAPLVFLLHGGNGNKTGLENGPLGEMFRLADQFGFYVVVPNGVETGSGLSGIGGDYHWNDCRSDAGVSSTFADDVGLVNALIDWMQASFAIDEQRVYAVGGSNGGMMSLRLATELSHRIVGVAALIANRPANRECPESPAYPTTILLMNGTAEQLWMPYDGGQILISRGLVESAEATRDFFVGFLGADPTPIVEVFADLDPLDGGIVEREAYDGGAEGARVLFYRMNGAGHAIPSLARPIGPGSEAVFGKQNRDFEAADEIWDQLSEVTLPEPDVATTLMVSVLALAGASPGRVRRQSAGVATSGFALAQSRSLGS